VIRDLHPPPTLRAIDQPTQERWTASGGADSRGQAAVSGQAFLVAQISILGDVGRDLVRDHHLPLQRFDSDLTGMRKARLSPTRIVAPQPKDITSCIKRMVDDRVEGAMDWSVPLQAPRLWPALHTHAQLDFVPHQVAEHGVDQTEFVELVEDQPDDELNLLVRVQGDPVGGQLDVAGGNLGKQLTAAGLVQLRVIEPLLLEVQLGLAHRPFQPQQQPIVVQSQVIDAVLIGQEGVENRAPLQKTIPVGVGPGQSTDLEAKDDSDVIEVHLGQEPLEAQSAVGGGAGFSLIVGDDDHPVGLPAPGDGKVTKAGLDFSRLFIVHYLIRTGLADINDGQQFEVAGLDLRGSRW
jgi:hypothetical protein